MKKKILLEELNQLGITIKDIPFLSIKGLFSWIKLKDKRSHKDKDGCWHIKPIGSTKKYLYIVCPYCGEIHHHRNNLNNIRIPHCKDRKTHKDYCIEDIEEYLY